MADRFISEKELEERRAQGGRYEYLAPTEPARPLYEQLQENRNKADEEFKERFKFRPPRALDEDEVAFLQEYQSKLTEQQKEQERLIREELSSFQRARDSVVVEREAPVVIAVDRTPTNNTSKKKNGKRKLPFVIVAKKKKKEETGKEEKKEEDTQKKKARVSVEESEDDTEELRMLKEQLRALREQNGEEEWSEEDSSDNEGDDKEKRHNKEGSNRDMSSPRRHSTRESKPPEKLTFVEAQASPTKKRKAKTSAVNGKEPTAKRGRGRPATTTTTNKERRRARSTTPTRKAAAKAASKTKKVVGTTAERQEKDYEVEEIVGKRVEVYYKVKWKGYPASQNTWEPEEHLKHCRKLVEEYERKAGQGSSS
ncbi:Chromo domain-containing protein [Balamuthia mandrillaris]